MKQIIFSLAMTLVSVFSFGQKFGYVNTQELVSSMPEVKAADTQLETHQKMLMANGQAKVGEFEAEYKKYMDDAQKGILSQVQIQEKEAQLLKKQEEIQKMENDMQIELTKKREELYKPLLDKVAEVIKAYGKENNYTMIFDSSIGSILHAAESDNLIAPLKLKLGIK
jgi:outer membrane protein